MSAYIVCPEHGDIYVERGAMSGDVVRVDKIERLDERVPVPAMSEVIRCFCGRTFNRMAQFEDGLREEIRAE